MKETAYILAGGPCQEEQRSEVGEVGTRGQQMSIRSFYNLVCVGLGKVFLFSFQTEAFSPALKDKQAEQSLRCFCHIMLGLFTNWLAVFYSAVPVISFVESGFLKIWSYLLPGVFCQRWLSDSLDILQRDRLQNGN